MSRVYGAAALLLLAGTVSAQSLGEAAAKERRRRERVQEKSAPAPRVITEDELAATKGRLANEPTDALANAPRAISVPNLPPPSSRTSSVDAERALHSQREAHWRMEAQRRREALSSAEAAVQRTARWSDPTYAGEDRPSCPIAARSEAKKARAAMASAQKNLAALEDDARRGGALPGWVR